MASSSSEDDGPDGLRALDIDTRGPVIPYLYHPRKRSKSFSDSAEDEQDEKRMKEEEDEEDGVLVEGLESSTVNSRLLGLGYAKGSTCSQCGAEWRGQGFVEGMEAASVEEPAAVGGGSAPPPPEGQLTWFVFHLNCYLKYSNAYSHI